MEGVTARDLMSREFVGVSEGDEVDEVLELMVEERADDVLVLHGSEPVGVVSCHDVLESVLEGEETEGRSVESVMSRPPESVTVGTDLGAVLARLTGVDAEQVPVVDGERELVGVVTEADVIAAATSMVTEPRSPESPGAPEPAATSERVVSQGTADVSERATSATQDGTEAYTNQGVCESCGSLTGDLQVQNGQSICPECRDV